jgi:DnaJ-class molecular chaperone
MKGLYRRPAAECPKCKGSGIVREELERATGSERRSLRCTCTDSDRVSSGAMDRKVKNERC